MLNWETRKARRLRALEVVKMQEEMHLGFLEWKDMLRRSPRV
jgi:hypothetical protein